MQALPAGYLAQRREWIASASAVAAALRLPNEALHDGLLLLDRAAAAGALPADDAPSAVTTAACLLLACEQHGEPSHFPVPCILALSCTIGSGQCSTCPMLLTLFRTRMNCTEV